MIRDQRSVFSRRKALFVAIALLTIIGGATIPAYFGWPPTAPIPTEKDREKLRAIDAALARNDVGTMLDALDKARACSTVAAKP